MLVLMNIVLVLNAAPRVRSALAVKTTADFNQKCPWPK